MSSWISSRLSSRRSPRRSLPRVSWPVVVPCMVLREGKKISLKVCVYLVDEMAQRLDELEASIKAGADASEGN